MKRLILFIVCLLSLSATVRANWEYDYYGAMAWKAAFVSNLQAEKLNESSLREIMKHYKSAEIATAGIYASKLLERKAMKDAGLLASRENYYYRHIRMMVADRIIPRLYLVGKELLKHPDKALYWGPWLFKICNEIEQLCMQFECVVCNGKQTFNDINFLTVNRALLQYFDMSEYGDINWKEVWNDLCNFPTNFKRRDIQADFKSVFGDVTIVLDNEAERLPDHAEHSFFEAIKEKPQDFQDILDSFNNVYEGITDGSMAKSILESVIGDLKDSLAVDRLFAIDGYDIARYKYDYVTNPGKTYYTQRWYIYHTEGGNQLWYYKQKWTAKRHYFFGDIEVYNAVFDSGVTDEQTFEREFRTHMRNSDFIEKGGKDYYQFYNPLAEKVDFEATFDSYTMDENMFSKEMEERRQAYERQARESGDEKTVFSIGKGDKNYYAVADAETVKGAAKATFTANCSEGLELQKGGFNFKVNERYDDSKRNDYAFPNTGVGPKTYPDTSEYEAKLDSLEDVLDDYSGKIQTLNTQIADLREELKIDTLTTQQKSDLTRQLNEAIYQRNEYESKYNNTENLYNEAMQHYAELQVDYNEELDGPYRIITVMNELARDLRITWEDNGSWSIHTYTCYGTVPGIDGRVKFTADVTKERGESWFWFIRYHRAIVGVEWKLTAEQESSDVVSVIELDMKKSDEERAEVVNQERARLQGDFPSCSIEVEFTYPDLPEEDSEEEALHLLFVSDRLVIAREIDERLVTIHSELALIQKWLLCTNSALEHYKEKLFGEVRRIHTGRRYDYALERWKTVATHFDAYN